MTGRNKWPPPFETTVLGPDEDVPVNYIELPRRFKPGTQVVVQRCEYREPIPEDVKELYRELKSVELREEGRREIMERAIPVEVRTMPLGDDYEYRETVGRGLELVPDGHYWLIERKTNE